MYACMYSMISFSIPFCYGLEATLTFDGGREECLGLKEDRPVRLQYRGEDAGALDVLVML